MANESQSTGFPPQRAASNAQEVMFARLEGRGVEIADQDLTLFAAVVGDGVDQVVAQISERGEIRNLARPQLLCQCEFGARPQPARKMVALTVIGDALLGNLSEPGFEFVQIAGTGHFGVVGQAENKVAKAEMFGQKPPEVSQQSRRAFAQERTAFGIGPRPEFCAAGLQNNGNVRHFFLDPSRQFETSFGTQLPAEWEFY